MSGRHTDMNIHIGKTYNFLKVESLCTDLYFYKNKTIKKTYFNCICECKNVKKILAGNVLNNSVKSCGCKKKNLIQKANDKHYENNKQFSVEKRMYSNYKLHGKNFELTFETFNNIIKMKCHYCGTEPDHLRYSKSKKFKVLLNGIDRVDSSEGYTNNNCVPCCTTCNYMKNTLKTSDFLNHVFKIAQHNKL